VAIPCRLCCVLGARSLAPDIEGVRPDLATVKGCKLISTAREAAANEGVGREEVLGLPRRFESLHLPLSSAGTPSNSSASRKAGDQRRIPA
jgi:hypothetical protein